MSECQYVAFRAIDAPVSEKNLGFMRQQSTRAKITAWSFDNEYHFGDFHGDALEMLRRGYDFHFHYADFGIRKLMIRFPHGLPDARTTQTYFEDGSLDFLKDKHGLGGILRLEPFIEPGDLDVLLDVGDLFDRLIPVRAEILDGDLRPLYLAHLAVASDGNHDPDEEDGAPVPAGLDKLTDAQHALAELYGLSDAFIAAAARGCPPLPTRANPDENYAKWLVGQPEATRIAWLRRLMQEGDAVVRREILAEFHKSHVAARWPTTGLDRTIAELKETAEAIQNEKKLRDAEEATRQRARKRADMAADPMRFLRKTDDLLEQRTLFAYDEIAMLLADLREALSNTNQWNLAEQQARKLKDENPTLRHLTAELRRQGFLKKKSD